MINNFNFFQPNINFITGVDEVGRGAWAGPMLAGAVGMSRSQLVKIKQSKWVDEINDSKKLSEKKRLELSSAIKEDLAYAIGEVSVGEINAWGLTRANQVAIRRAMEKLPKADLIIGDGNLSIPRSFVEYRSIVKADQTVWLVAAASIVAKVERDRIMREVFHSQFPHYGFDRHVGYGTKYHQEMIKKFGFTVIHRKNYRFKF